jgi:hypothetical protein
LEENRKTYETKAKEKKEENESEDNFRLVEYPGNTVVSK